MIIVEVPGEPIGKGRPRFRVGRTKSGQQFVNAYTPAKTKAAEKALGWAAKTAMKGRKPMDGPLCVTVMAFMGVPPSWSNRKRDAALAGIIRPTGTPDWDNIGKLCTDAMNGIVFRDDSQIVDCRVVKAYDENPRIRIGISGLTTSLEATA